MRPKLLNPPSFSRFIWFALSITAVVFVIALRPAATQNLPAQKSILNLSDYHVTFSDNFSNLSLKAHAPGARWITQTPWHGDFGDAAFSDPNPAAFKSTPNGLQIIASQAPDGKWRSGLICSAWEDNNPHAGFTQEYGYFQMTAKLPSGMGTWPAFWLIGSDKRKSVSEIDVIEYYGGFPRHFHTTEHVWVNGKNQLLRSIVPEVPAGQLSNRFNRFGVLITPKFTSFYLNRKEYWSTPTPPEYRQPMYILANLALGSGWPISGLKSPVIM
jgi:Glycosyl hydrolases family 16